MSTPETEHKLTQYSRGAGCGCKIAPQVLNEILKGNSPPFEDPRLIVGHSGNEDAAVYDLGDGNALISTTDFFMPVVDDAFAFGQIAAANAISDVYAMGGKPALALAILGWPIDKLPASLAAKVMEGARAICAKAGILIAGGHSVDSAEPLFGLAVNGFVKLNHLKRNCTAKKGDLVFLTKAIGTGILSTALKRGLLETVHQQTLIKQMTELNAIGETLGQISGVSAMTDITGFGLMGHSIEMAKGAGVSIELAFNRIPQMPELKSYLDKNVLPDASFRNWNAYQADTQIEKSVDMNLAFQLLPDPQTNGGLLFTVNPEAEKEVQKLLDTNGYSDFTVPIGRIVERKEKLLYLI
jgi:selenide, water dikinase